MKKLSKETLKAIDILLGELNTAMEEAQSYFDEKSEKWQASDSGTNYSAWIEGMELTVDALENLPDAPGD